MAVRTKNKAEKPGTANDAGFSEYIGPSIVGVIQTNTIFPVGKEDALKLPEVLLALEKEPRIAELLIDGSTLPQDIIKVKTPGEALYKAYRALRK